MKNLFRIKKWSIAPKIFFTLFILMGTLFASLAWKNMTDSEEIYKEQLLNDANLLVEQANHLIDTYLENIGNVMIYLSSQHFLLEKDREEEIIEFLSEYGDINGSLIKAFYIIHEDGKILSNKQVYYDILGNPNLNKLVEIAKENYGGLNWSEPYYSPISGETIGFVIPIFDGDHKNGVAVAEMNLDSLERKLTPLLGGNSRTYMIMSEEGEIVSVKARHPLLSYQSSYLKRLNPEFIEQLISLDEGIDEIDNHSTTLVTIKSDHNRLRWNLIILIDKQFFYRNIETLYEGFRNTMILWVIIIVFFSIMMTYFITNPIRKLASKMDNINDIDNLSSISLNREDEFGQLAKSFNAMMTRIKRLVNELREMEIKKKDYELKMLQSQISPHFLYNTLACIGSLAKQQKITEVRETIKSLVLLLSFSFNRSSEFITLEEEIEGIKQYSYIQHVRFGDKYNLILQIEPSALRCKIFSFILQPIIENAIIHGIATCKEKREIIIKGKIVDEDLILFIRDNGVGMEKSIYKNLLIIDKEGNKHKGFNSIGLKNVNDRIQIQYGYNYGLTIRSKKDIGTVVKVKLPANF